MTRSTGPRNRHAPAFGERIMLRQYIHWRRLIGATVQIRQHGQLIRTGTVDDAMADSTALWIAGDATQPRTMYEAARGIEVWADTGRSRRRALLPPDDIPNTITQLS